MIKKILIGTVIFTSALSPILALAGPGDVPGDLPQLKENVSTPKGIYGIVERIANWIFAVLIILAVIFILLAAFTYLTSGGGEEVKKAHKQLLYAAIAIAVAVLAKGIVAAVRVVVETPIGS